MTAKVAIEKVGRDAIRQIKKRMDEWYHTEQINQMAPDELINNLVDDLEVAMDYVAELKRDLKRRTRQSNELRRRLISIARMDD